VHALQAFLVSTTGTATKVEIIIIISYDLKNKIDLQIKLQSWLKSVSISVDQSQPFSTNLAGHNPVAITDFG